MFVELDRKHAYNKVNIFYKLTWKRSECGAILIKNIINLTGKIEIITKIYESDKIIPVPKIYVLKKWPLKVKENYDE